MLARDLMRRNVKTIREDQPLNDLVEMLIRERIHAAPVLDESEDLVGVVTQQDVFFSTVTRGDEEAGRDSGEENPGESPLKVSDIMTSPPVSAEEGTHVRDLCRMMHRLRIHRIPIVCDGKVSGIVSSLDVCRVMAEWEE